VAAETRVAIVGAGADLGAEAGALVTGSLINTINFIISYDDFN